jgi:hypothetical protein
MTWTTYRANGQTACHPMLVGSIRRMVTVVVWCSYFLSLSPRHPQTLLDSASKRLPTPSPTFHHPCIRVQRMHISTCREASPPFLLPPPLPSSSPGEPLPSPILRILSPAPLVRSATPPDQQPPLGSHSLHHDTAPARARRHISTPRRPPPTYAPTLYEAGPSRAGAGVRGRGWVCRAFGMQGRRQGETRWAGMW